LLTRISMGWLYVFMGVIISSAVLPATLTLMWKGQNRMAAMLSPILGLACSITAWLVTTAKLNDGVISVATSGANNPMLAGNVVALLSPMVFIPVLTLIFGMGAFNPLPHRRIFSNENILTPPQTTTTGSP
jgi:Na+/proline symporter